MFHVSDALSAGGSLLVQGSRLWHVSIDFILIEDLVFVRAVIRSLVYVVLLFEELSAFDFAVREPDIGQLWATFCQERLLRWHQEP